jgi:hypothetical protein
LQGADVLANGLISLDWIWPAKVWPQVAKWIEGWEKNIVSVIIKKKIIVKLQAKFS